MPYVYIDPSRYDAESPLTESLFSDIINNIQSVASSSYTVLTGAGTYTVPAGVTKLQVIMISGGGGGGGNVVVVPSYNGGGGGGGGGRVLEANVSTTGGASIAYSCGAGGAGGGVNVDGSNGGNTTFGALTCLGGEGGKALLLLSRVETSLETRSVMLVVQVEKEAAMLFLLTDLQISLCLE